MINRTRAAALFSAAFVFFAVDLFLLSVSAQMMINAHQRDLCFLDANCKKV